MIINGIEQREFKDTLVPRTFDLGDYGSTTLNVYQYNHDYKKLYREFELDKRLMLQPYTAPVDEAAVYKGIPMRYRWNAVIKELMMTGRYRIKYRGVSKKAVGYKRKPNYCLAEYADVFAIYRK
jgi:hypothetical protein